MSFFSPAAIVQRTRDTKTRNIRSPVKIKLNSHPTHPRGGHPSHSNLVRGKLTSPTPNPAGDGTSGLTSYPRRRSKVSEAACLRPQRSAPARTRTRAAMVTLESLIGHVFVFFSKRTFLLMIKIS